MSLYKPADLPNNRLGFRIGFDGHEPEFLVKHLAAHLTSPLTRVTVTIDTYHPEIAGANYFNRALLALVQEAHERVTVTVPLRDETGASIGVASQPANRNRWEVIKLDSLGVREQHQLKETVRVGTQEPVVPRFDHTAARTDRTPNVTRSPALERTRDRR